MRNALLKATVEMESMLKPVIVSFFIFLLGCITGNTSNLTAHDTKGKNFIEPCSEKLNCVSSVEQEENKHYVPTLRYTGKKALAY